MKRLLSTLTLVLLLTSGLSAQLLWKVTGKNLPGPSYLFGTHHVAPASVLDSVAGLRDAFASAEKIYGEVKMSEMTSPEGMQKMMGYIMAPADSTLTKVLTPEQQTRLNSFLKEYMGPMADISQADATKPALLSSQIAIVFSMIALPGFNPQQQLDQMVQQQAETDGKTVAGLESLDDQYELLFNAPISLQAKDLMETVENSQEEIRITRELANAYRTGDLKKIYELMSEEFKENPDKMDALLTARNRKWVEKLKKELPEGSSFIAVGAGHLPGPEGLIELLRKEGLEVTPM